MIPLLLAGCSAGPADPPAAVVGERLFLEPRFAQFFAANAGDALNRPLAAGDPTLDVEIREGGDVPGPFAGATMSCRQCHLVDDVNANVHQPVRAYADFARRSAIPDRGDGFTTTVRNSPALVDMSLPRDNPYFLHFDGEFTSPEGLVRGTFTGRNLGWLANEYDLAVAHIAAVIRTDDGTFPLVADSATIPYPDLFGGTAAAIPEAMRLPADLRLEVDEATDAELLEEVAALVAAYLENIQFARGLESGELNGSPYDVFLAKNDLPRQPDAGEGAAAYAERLGAAVDTAWVTDVDQRFSLHDQPFQFGEQELRGLRTFLAEPLDPAGASEGEVVVGGVGNCVTCHLPPQFTDYGMHNTGVSQEEYDGVWGEGAFAGLLIPDLATRDADPGAWLPASPTHPSWSGAMRSIPNADNPGGADLGAWTMVANGDHPEGQDGLAELFDGAYALGEGANDAERLGYAVALFKTPSLRDLVQSAPYLHDGSADDFDGVLAHYQRVGTRQRAGSMPPI